MAFYLFPGVMYQRFEESSFTSESYTLSYTLKEDYQLYDLACRQYLGLGFLFQFIPGTNANKARQQLSNKLEPAIEACTSQLQKYKEAGVLYKYGTYSRLYSYLNFAPLLGFITQLLNGFKLGDITRTKGHSELRGPRLYIKSNQFSVASLIIIPLMIPVVITKWLLDSLHNGVNRIFNLGTRDNEKSSLPRIFLKGVASLVFGLLKAPLIAVDHLMLLTRELIETLIISPIVYLGTRVYEAYSNSDEKVLFATVKELQDVKELRRTAKAYVECSYTVMKSMQANSREYIGIKKVDLYSSAAKPEKIVALQGSAEKIGKSAALLSIVNSYSAKNKIAKNEIEAVEEAKSVLNVGM